MTKLELINTVLSDIHELKMILVSKDVGVLTEVKIQFLGDSEPTSVKISNERLTEQELNEKLALGGIDVI